MAAADDRLPHLLSTPSYRAGWRAVADADANAYVEEDPRVIRNLCIDVDELLDLLGDINAYGCVNDYNLKQRARALLDSGSNVK